MSYIKKKLWLLPMIGSILTLISLFTPITTLSYSGSFSIQWMFQLGLRIEPAIEFLLWRGVTLEEIPLLFLSITLSLINFASSILLIFLTLKYKRNSISYLKLKKQCLLFGILIIISTLTWIVVMEVFYIISWGVSHWQFYSPNFGVIGPFIGSALIIGGFFLLKKEDEWD
ncbi:MAG: hypothetical protein ACFE9S_16325 [Candidatus Hermodarchaeota archaeon]